MKQHKWKEIGSSALAGLADFQCSKCRMKKRIMARKKRRGENGDTFGVTEFLINDKWQERPLFVPACNPDRVDVATQVLDD